VFVVYTWVGLKPRLATDRERFAVFPAAKCSKMDQDGSNGEEPGKTVGESKTVSFSTYGKFVENARNQEDGTRIA
jgi:hypothetical protein